MSDQNQPLKNNSLKTVMLVLIVLFVFSMIVGLGFKFFMEPPKSSDRDYYERAMLLGSTSDFILLTDSLDSQAKRDSLLFNLHVWKTYIEWESISKMSTELARQRLGSPTNQTELSLYEEFESQIHKELELEFLSQRGISPDSLFYLMIYVQKNNWPAKRQKLLNSIKE